MGKVEDIDMLEAALEVDFLLPKPEEDLKPEQEEDFVSDTNEPMSEEDFEENDDDGDSDFEVSSFLKKATKRAKFKPAKAKRNYRYGPFH